MKLQAKTASSQEFSKKENHFQTKSDKAIKCNEKRIYEKN